MATSSRKAAALAASVKQNKKNEVVPRREIIIPRRETNIPRRETIVQRRGTTSLYGEVLLVFLAIQ